MSVVTEEDLGPGQTKPSRLRDWIWTPLVPCLRAGFLALPPSWLEPLSRLAARLWSTWPREREIMRRNFDRVLGIDLDSDEGAKLGMGVYRNLVICGMESIRAAHQPELVKLEGLAEVRHMLGRIEAEGKGQLLVTAHLGSWEMINIFSPDLLEGKFWELAKPMRIKALTKYLDQMRLKAGVHVIWNNEKLLLRKMLRVLRHGDTLGLAADQKPKGLRGPVVDFFGRPTEFVGGPGTVASRTGCGVVTVFCTRLSSFTYRLTCEVLYEPSDEERDAKAVTQRIAHSIERAVRETPEQWPWTYRRWIYDDDGWQGPRGEKPSRSSKSNSESRACPAGEAPGGSESTAS